MDIKNKKTGFSLSELMIIMLLVSIALAASIPIITKKHLKLPTSNVEHGVYICYYDATGQLHEARYANQFGVSKPLFDRIVPAGKSCVFNPPQKAAYFQISAVGGGGGGGDSGYNGGNVHAGWTDLAEFNLINGQGSPFNITQGNIDENGGIGITEDEFKSVAGTLYAFARGADSGRGGAPNYVTRTLSGYKYNEAHSDLEDIVNLGDYDNYYYCTDKEPGKHDKLYDGPFDTFEYKVIEPIWSEDRIGTIYENCRNEERKATECVCGTCSGDASFCNKFGSHWCQWNRTKVDRYCCKDSKTGEKIYCTSEKINADQCPTGANLDCTVIYDPIISDTSTSCPADKVKTVTTTVRVCDTTAQYGDKYVSGLTTKTYTYNPKAYGKYCYATDKETLQDRILSNDNKDIQDFIKNNNNQGQYYSEDDAVPIYIYTADRGSTYAGAAGKGAVCRTQDIPGGLNISYDESQKYTIYGTAQDGEDLTPYYGSSNNQGKVNGFYTSEATASDGMARCEEPANTCSGQNPVQYSKYKITTGTGESAKTYSVKATSSPQAGKGGKRGITKNTDTQPNASTRYSNWAINQTSIETDNGNRIDLGKYNTLTKGADGTNGECSKLDSTHQNLPENTITLNNLCVSNYTNPPYYGYCLKHQYSSYYSGYPQDEYNGAYRYRHSFDENYLQYGNPGDAGEYKSVVVRSFDNMDTTIRIGRGGAGGIKGSGASGGDGSPTSIGTILTAEGGKGGKGGIVGLNSVLPKYKANEYRNEDLCFNKDKYCLEDVNGNVANPTKCQEVLDLETEATCETRFSTYTYHMRTGQLPGGIPVLSGLSSNLFSYVLPKVVDDITSLFNQAGHGGQGGGVTHNCWAGQWITDFDNSIFQGSNGKLFSNDVYPGATYNRPGNATTTNSPAGAAQVPEGCYTNYEITEATDGVDGALMIKW